NRLNVLVAREMLEAAGARVRVATDGEEALEILSRDDFDAILMDVQMPGISGYEAATRIHAMRGKEDLPIVAVTANAMTQDREKAARAGMCDYVPKPFRYAELFRAISRCTNSPEPMSCPSCRPAQALTEARYVERDATFASMDGIDIKTGLERSMGNATLFLQMLRIFRRDLEQSAPRLAVPVRPSDFPDIAKLAHYLKGGAGSVGATSLLHAAAGLEEACRNGDEAAAREQRLSTLKEVERVRDSTRAIVEEEPTETEVSSPDAKRPANGADPELLETIASGLEVGSVDALEELLGLLPYLEADPESGLPGTRASIPPPLLIELRLRAEAFRLDAASSIVRDIAARIRRASPAGPVSSDD
ncbi:MAG TPA: response regulator, partial [Rectinemataceae bacterium]|nr:response regulator [Rectinemataceae bacterium]